MCDDSADRRPASCWRRCLMLPEDSHLGPRSTWAHSAHQPTMLSPQVLVDINWRPVFWDDESSASAAIKPYACKADVVKMSDEEAEWLFGIPAQEALQHPLKVTPLYLAADVLLGLKGGYDIVSALAQLRR